MEIDGSLIDTAVFRRFCSEFVLFHCHGRERTAVLKVPCTWFNVRHIFLLFLWLKKSTIKSFLHDAFDLNVFGFVRVESMAVVRFEFVAFHSPQMVVARLHFCCINSSILLGNHLCQFSCF